MVKTKRVLALVGFLAGLLGILVGLSALFVPKNNMSEFGMEEVTANGILGEVSPAMAAAVSGAECKKVLIPSSTCGVLVAGTEERRLEDYLNSAVDLALGEIARLAGQRA